MWPPLALRQDWALLSFIVFTPWSQPHSHRQWPPEFTEQGTQTILEVRETVMGHIGEQASPIPKVPSRGP